MSSEVRDSGLIVHRWLQVITTVGVTVMAAAVMSGWSTWDGFKAFQIRMEDVPADLKEVKAALNEQGKELDNLKNEVSNIKATIKPR